MVDPEEHTSPDGMLVLTVEPLEDGDCAIGFREFSWHTHADILATMRSTSESDAVRQFVDDVLSDRSLIAVQVIGDKTHDAWITDNPAEDCKYLQSTEKIRFRYWSGREFLPGSNDSDV